MNELQIKYNFLSIAQICLKIYEGTCTYIPDNTTYNLLECKEWLSKYKYD